jgi:hypothetical protein
VPRVVVINGSAVWSPEAKLSDTGPAEAVDARKQTKIGHAQGY